jgi:hypothetical protein
VAAGAGLRDPVAGFGQQRATLGIGQAAGIVGAVAIGADCRLQHAPVSGLLVGAVQRALVLARVAALAGGIELQAQVTPVGGLEAGVGVPAQASVALNTGIPTLPMYGLRVALGIDEQR